MKKIYRILAMLLTVCLCAGLLPGFTLFAGAVDAVPLTTSPYTYASDRATLERMVQQTALAYFYKGSAIQYGSYQLSRGNRYAAAIVHQTNNRLPEDASDLNPIYTVCSAFPQDVYYSLFGKHIISNSLAPAASQLNNARIDMSRYSENDPAIAYAESLLNVTALFAYHGAMARAAGMDVTSFIQQEDRDNSGVSAADREKYADVVFYFGPEVNENKQVILEAARTGTLRLYELSGNNMVVIPSVNGSSVDADGNALTLADNYTILWDSSTGAAIKKSIVTGTDANGDDVNTVFYAVGRRGDSDSPTYTYVSSSDYSISGRNNTLSGISRADVEKMFCELLRPGDIIVDMNTGDADADASDSGHAMMYLGDVDGDGIAEVIHSSGSQYDSSFGSTSQSENNTSYVTQATFDAATSRDSFDGSHQFSYGAMPAYRSSLTTTAAKSGQYLRGYELWEGTRNDWANIASDTAGNAGTGGLNASLQGRNGGGSLRINEWISLMGYRRQFASASKKIDLSKPYGNGRINYSSSGESAPYYIGSDSDCSRKTIQFIILRPLAKASFIENLTPSAKERQILQDLSITKTASPNPYQTVTTGDTITYTLDLVNNEGLTSDRTTTTYANFGDLDVTGTYTVNVTETIPEGATLTATPEGATVSGNTITWSNVSVPDGASGAKSLSYTVSVNSALGGAVVSPSGKVKSTTSSSETSYLTTSKISHLVGGPALTGVTSGLSLDTTGSGTDIARDVYGSLGIPLTLPTVPALVDTLFEQDYWANESTAYRMKYRLRDPGDLDGADRILRNMLVQDYVGGTRVETYDEIGMKTNMTRLRNFSEEFLAPGDILVYADYDRTAAKATGGETYVYLGSGHYAHYNNSTGAYENLNAPLKLVQSGKNSARFLYSSILTQAHRYEFAFLLRPSQALADVTVGGDFSTPESGAVLRVTIDGGAPIECGTMEAAATVQRTAILDAWAAAGSPKDDPWDYPDIRVELLKDISMYSSAYFYGYADIDLGGHTLITPDSGEIILYVAGGSSAKGGGGNFTIRNGTILGAYTCIYESGTGNTLTLDNVTVLGGYMRDESGNSVSHTTSGISDESWGHAIKKLAGTTLYLNNCVIGTAGTEKPIHNGHATNSSYDELIHIRDNVTFLIPGTIVSGHSGWNTASSTTMVRETNPNGSKATRYTRSTAWNTSLNKAYPCPAQNYSVVTYTTTPAATAGGLRKATLSDALADVASGKAVTLLRDVDLSSRGEVGAAAVYDPTNTDPMDVTVPANVTLTTGAYTINGMGNVYVMPGGSYGTVTVPDFSGVSGPWVRNTGYLAAPSLWSTGRQTLTLLDGIVVNAAIPVQAGTTYYIWLDGAESAIPASLQSGNACFDLKDCYAFEMTAQVPAILLAVKGETTSISPVHSFSVKGYADSALSRVNWESEDDVGYTLGAKLGRALTAMLDYGALAQTYFEENTETLANADVPAAARTSLSDAYTMSRLNENRDSAPVTATGSDPSVYYGASCVLGRKLDMKFYFRLASTAGITGVAAYTDHEGKTVEQPITASDLTKNETGDFYSYKVTGLNAADVCSGVTVTLRRGGADLVTVTDSIANYTARIYQERISATDPKEIAVRDLANAMMTYGLSAADYLEGHAAPSDYTPEPGETSIG